MISVRDLSIFTLTIVLLLFLLLSDYSLNALASNSVPVSVTVITPACNDGADNDGDLSIDYPLDPGCSSLIDNNETNPAVTYQCNDGIDNDSDGKIDFPADLGCDFATDNSESGEIINNTNSSNSNSGANGPVLNSIASESKATVSISGNTKKGASVVIIADGRSIGQTVADNDGKFIFFTDNLTAGFYLFDLYAKDASNRKSPSYSFAVHLSKGMITQLSGIALLPIESLLPGMCPPKGDLNDDCRVDIIDFSIASYWWHRNLSEDFISLEKNKLSGDGEINLEDFSILAYYWTG